jgi:putative hemolysin
VGEIADEFDPDNKYLTQLGEREWLVDGRFSIEDAADLGWPIKDSDEYETIAGFVLEQFDRLPKPGDIIVVEGFEFRVQSMRGRRVSMLRVTAPVPEEAQEDEEERVSGTDALVSRVQTRLGSPQERI